MDRGFIFDMDGVIIDSEPLYVRVEQKMFQELGLKVTPEKHLAFTGIPIEDMWDSLKNEFSLDIETKEWAVQESERINASLRVPENVNAIEGVVPLLGELTRLNFQVGLASSSPREQIDLVLDTLGISSFFRCTVSGDEVQNGKPAPDSFLQCVAGLGTDPRRTFVLEDSANGVLAARAGGLHAIGFANPATAGQDLRQAELVVDQINTDIARYVDKIVSENLDTRRL